MTVDDLERKEEDAFRTGPLSVLTTSVKTNSQVRDPCCIGIGAQVSRVPDAGSEGEEGKNELQEGWFSRLSSFPPSLPSASLLPSSVLRGSLDTALCSNETLIPV
jgi:hypothetical protein